MWFLYVVLASFWATVYYFGNQIANITPNVFMIYRGAIPALLLLPFLPFVSYIQVWQFYAFCVLQGGVIAFVDYRNFKAMRAWGAEAVSALHPLSIGAVFILWILVKPQILLGYMNDWGRFCLIIIALCGIIYAVVSLKKSTRSKQILQYLQPYFIGVAFIDVINKQCMSYVDADLLPYASYFYIMITGAVIAIINFFVYVKNNNKINLLFDKSNLKYSLIIIFLIFFMVSKNYAIFEVSNPSFVTATLYLYIVWIMIAGQIMRMCGKDGGYLTINRGKVFILLACTVLLVLLDS
ncbi:MAG: hypothetical protein IJ532_06120 [Alphaproteobacteria bacterium]|nr:hypothetical protein [Alphaproteobacteria bacterium]